MSSGGKRVIGPRHAVDVEAGDSVIESIRLGPPRSKYYRGLLFSLSFSAAARYDLTFSRAYSKRLQ